MSLPIRGWFMSIKFWIALHLKELQRPLWSLGMELHPCDLIHQLKKNWYSMKIYCQRPIHYLLLIDAESWSLKVEVNSSLSQIFNGKQSEELKLGGQEVHLMKHQLITPWLPPLGEVVWQKFDSSSVQCRWGVVNALLCSPLSDWALGTTRSYGRSRQECKQLEKMHGVVATLSDGPEYLALILITWDLMQCHGQSNLHVLKRWYTLYYGECTDRKSNRSLTTLWMSASLHNSLMHWECSVCWHTFYKSLNFLKSKVALPGQVKELGT